MAPVTHICVPDADAVRKKTARAAILEHWFRMGIDNFSLKNIDIDESYRRSTLFIATAVKHSYYVTLYWYRQWVCRMASQFWVLTIRQK